MTREQLELFARAAQASVAPVAPEPEPVPEPEPLGDPDDPCPPDWPKHLTALGLGPREMQRRQTAHLEARYAEQARRGQRRLAREQAEQAPGPGTQGPAPAAPTSPSGPPGAGAGAGGREANHAVGEHYNAFDPACSRCHEQGGGLGLPDKSQ